MKGLSTRPPADYCPELKQISIEEKRKIAIDLIGTLPEDILDAYLILMGFRPKKKQE